MSQFCARVLQPFSTTETGLYDISPAIHANDVRSFQRFSSRLMSLWLLMLQPSLTVKANVLVFGSPPDAHGSNTTRARVHGANRRPTRCRSILKWVLVFAWTAAAPSVVKNTSGSDFGHTSRRPDDPPRHRHIVVIWTLSVDTGAVSVLDSVADVPTVARLSLSHPTRHRCHFGLMR